MKAAEADLAADVREEADPVVREILSDTILRGERAFGWIRIGAAALSLILIAFFFGPSWHDGPRVDMLNLVLLSVIIGSAVVLYRLQQRGPGRGLLGASLALDRIGVFLMLICLMRWPAAAYPGLGRVPELGFVFIVTIAAGLRLSTGLALLAGVFDCLGLAVLLRLDRLYNPAQISTTVANEVMVLLIAGCCAGIACLFSKRSAQLVARGATEARDAERTRQRLGAYVSTELLDLVLSDGSEKLGGVRRSVVVLFSDLRGFTSYSEARNPEALVAELNRYFEAMLEVIHAHGGVVDKFIGDAIMAVWGVVESKPDDALQALRAARAMGTALTAHNEERQIAGLSPLQQGIGLHLGEVIAGNIGTQIRRQYTVVGDPVNIASRLEAMTKEHGVDVLISATLLEAAATADGETPPVEHRGTVKVRGRQAKVDIYSLD